MQLDAQSMEYIHQLSPSVGFTISLSDRADTVQDQWMLVSPGLHSVVSVNKVTAGHYFRKYAFFRILNTPKEMS